MIYQILYNYIITIYILINIIMQRIKEIYICNSAFQYIIETKKNNLLFVIVLELFFLF